MFLSIHDAIVAYVKSDFESDYPGVALVFENDPFDWDNLPEVFVTVETKFYSANQIGASSSPKSRVSGFVYVCAHVREGTGNKLALQIIQWFADKLQFQTTSGVHLQAAEAVPEQAPKGWHTEDLKVAFYADPA